MQNSTDQWQLVISLTQQMQQLSEGEGADWEKLSVLQQQREQLLSELFAHGASTEQRDDIQALMQANQSMSEILLQHQFQLSQNFHKILSSKPGINAYQQVLDHKA